MYQFFPLNIPVLSWVLYVLTVLPLDKLGELEELVPLVGEVVVEPPLASAFNLLNTGFQMRFASSNLLFAFIYDCIIRIFKCFRVIK